MNSSSSVILPRPQSTGHARPTSVLPYPEGDSDADEVRRRVRKQVYVGTGIGSGVVLLILLLLLLLQLAAKQVASMGGGSGQTAAEGEDAGGSPGEAGEGTPGDLQSVDASGSAGVQGAGRASSAEDAGQGSSETRSPIKAVFNIPDQPGGGKTSQRETGDQVGQGGGGGGTGRFGSRRGSSDGSEFFGIRAKGNRFVYIVDCSGSMNGAPFQKACKELLTSIGGLKSRQHFYVFFFDNSPFPMFHPSPAESDLLRASPENVERVTTWVNGFRGGGGTNPQEALLRSLELNPDAIYLLSDGQFDDTTTVDIVRNKNTRKIVINTIGFMTKAGEPLLQRIAEENRGQYRFVP